MISAIQVQGGGMSTAESSLYNNNRTFGGNPSVESFQSVLGSFSSSKAPQISANLLKLDDDVDAFFRTREFKTIIPNAHESSSTLSRHRPGSIGSVNTMSSIPLQTQSPLEQALNNSTSIFTETDGQLTSGTLEGFFEYILLKNASEP